MKTLLDLVQTNILTFNINVLNKIALNTDSKPLLHANRIIHIRSSSVETNFKQTIFMMIITFEKEKEKRYEK